MNFIQIQNLTEQYIIPTYKRFSISFTKGEGIYLYDTEGKKYLDFISGLGVTNLGHSHPKIVKAIKRVNLLHTSNLYYVEHQAKLAEYLVKKSFVSKVFFCNSGTEANEAAIKLARKYSKLKFGNEKFEIITMKNSFHGRTLASLTATAQEKYQKGFEPLVPGFKYVKFNDFEELEKEISDRTCAIMIEPIQGEGGINVAEKDYLLKVKQLCDQKNILLILDEVQCGLWRTGKMFAYMHYNIEPDILTLAKALANGLPIGAILAKKEIAECFTPGSHASTFGGGPFVSYVALCNLKIIESIDISNVADYFKQELEKLKTKYSFIKEIRGKGLMLGMELEFNCQEIILELQKLGILINCTMDKVLRFLPPLIIKKKDVNKVIKALNKVFKGL